MLVMSLLRRTAEGAYCPCCYAWIRNNLRPYHHQPAAHYLPGHGGPQLVEARRQATQRQQLARNSSIGKDAH